MNNRHQPQDLINQKYQILTLLGEGGMGKTYSAINLETQQKVAIKVVSLAEIKDWKILDLFEREAKVLATLNHPFIPAYLDYFYLDTENNRTFYLIQELVEGESLANLVNQGWRSSEAEIKEIAIHILEILSYLHRLYPPVIHRDIKPQNIIRRPDGKVYLVDFGAVEDVCRHTLSYSNTFVGTLGYMSPEQLRGQATFSSDLYSLGTTLLFLLTHRPPNELPQVRMKFDLSKLSLSPEFEQWLNKILEPLVEDRFLSAQEALKVLKGHQKITVNAPVNHTPTLYSKPKGTRIKLKKINNTLKIQIPLNFTANFKFYNLSRKIFILVISMILGLFFAQIFPLIVTHNYQLILFLIILMISIIFIVFYTIILPFFDFITYLEISPKYFRIKSLFCQEKIKGNTQELTIIDLKKRYKKYDQFQIPISTCLMRYHGKNYFLGAVTKVELLWLQEEIKNFLNELQEDDFNIPTPHYLKGSRILFSQNSEELMVNIPPQKPGKMITFIKSLLAFGLICVDLIFLSLIFTFPPSLFYQLGQFLLMVALTVYYLITIAWSIDGKILLKINYQEIILKKTCFSWQFFQKGQTKNIVDFFSIPNRYYNSKLIVWENTQVNKVRKTYPILSHKGYGIEGYEIEQLTIYLEQFLKKFSSD